VRVNCLTCTKEAAEDEYHCYCRHPKVDRNIRHRFTQHACPVHEYKKECKELKSMECMKYSARFVRIHLIEPHKICGMCETWNKVKDDEDFS